jgi:hypothetical protein
MRLKLMTPNEMTADHRAIPDEAVSSKRGTAS